MSASEISVMLRQAVTRAVPRPGQGETQDRFDALAGWSALDLSLGRLAEGHFDALAILAEAGREPESDAIYGVWAARSSTGGTTAREEGDGWLLSGQKGFCSGTGLINRALITADTASGYLLFDIAVSENVTSALPDSWSAVGMADSASETLVFGGPAVPPDRVVGSPGFYLDRPGFWFGATGVAACWYGGAAGLVDHVVRSLDPSASDLVLSSLGQAVAHVGAMRLLLAEAAREIDADPTDAGGQARGRALVVRQAVHHAASEVLDHVSAAGGARPLCHDRRQGQRAADLYVYLAQHHGPRDAAELGRLALEGGSWR